MELSKIPSTHTELPEEVLIEILSRLPVKTLIRFTSVCKYWFSLIKSPQFATTHFATRINLLQSHDCDYLVTFSFYSDPIVRFLSYETLEISAIFECKPIDNSIDPVFRFSWSFFGPCNGILCIHVRKDRSVLLLWNPATRELFLPDQPPQILDFVGFGFDCKTNDYKIIMFDYSRNVQLYSLRRNSWKDIEVGFSFGEEKDTFLQIDPTTSGRMCTWIVYDCELDGFCLLSFDMVDEVFVETPMSVNIKGCYSICFMQQRSNGVCPALLCYDLVESCSRAAQGDVWVLNEYGSSRSWTKERSLAWDEHIVLGPPRGLWKNEGVLFLGQERVLTYYNSVTQEMRSLQVPGQQLLGYTESLISIKDVCRPEDSEDHSTKKAFQQTKELKDSDEEDKDVDIQDIPYCICEVKQQTLSNSITF